MKKVLCTFLAIIMLTVCFSSASVNAANIEEKLIPVCDAPEQVTVDDQFVVNVKVPAGQSVSCGRAILAFDSAKLEIVSAEVGEWINGFSCTYEINLESDLNGSAAVRCSFACESDTDKNGGSVLKVTFKALASGTCNFVLDEHRFYKAFSESTNANDPDRYSTEAVTKALTIKDKVTILYGDADGNGRVNAVDARTVAKHAAKIITLEGERFTAADVDGNGRVNVTDARTIAKYAAKLISVFPVENKN